MEKVGDFMGHEHGGGRRLVPRGHDGGVHGSRDTVTDSGHADSLEAAKSSVTRPSWGNWSRAARTERVTIWARRTVASSP